MALTTLDNVRTMLGIDPADTSVDAVLNLLIASQSAFFETQANRAILTASYTETLDGHSDRIRARTAWSPWRFGYGSGLGARGAGYALTLLNTPVVGITSITVDGAPIPQGSNPGQDTQVDGWTLIGDRIELIGSTYAFTPGTGNVAIVYTAGYGATAPLDVEQAVIELVDYRFRERDRRGVRSQVIGQGSVVYQTDAIPPSAQAIIDQYRRRPVKP